MLRQGFDYLNLHQNFTTQGRRAEGTMSFWEPYTERARRAVVLAQEEAQRLGNNYIGTEHLLLGIISEGESLACVILRDLNVTLAKVRQEVEAIVGRGGQTVQQEMVFTPRGKRVLELALEEARQLSQDYIGCEHLLLGLIREGDGVAVRVLTNLGVNPVMIRSKITAKLLDEPTTTTTGIEHAKCAAYTRIALANRPPDADLQDAIKDVVSQACGVSREFLGSLEDDTEQEPEWPMQEDPFVGLTTLHLLALDDIEAFGFNIPDSTRKLIWQVGQMCKEYVGQRTDRGTD